VSGNLSQGLVTQRTGSSPRSCTRGLDRQVCTWRIEIEGAVRTQFAGTGAGAAAVHLVCDFSLDDTNAHERLGADQHCTIHEPPRSTDPPPHSPLVDPDPPAVRLQKARTLIALSHAVASSPQNCVQRDDAEWVCSWVAQPGEPGHAMLGALADTGGAARLVCRLPLEGG
jgi:hypothetical protein